ncbi:hypothetical protein GOBAR_DD14362 [Gossypium barbadense]|nr:hypothetical protein GOBAR_DD14362 [Gossypium barbadense]
MNARINAKIYRRYRRMISKIFYKFPVSTNPVKFIKMELVDDEDVETMVDLYCGNGSEKNAPIHLFAELVGMEQNASNEEDGAEEPRMVAPISYVDSESTMGGIGIDLNFTPDVDMVGGEEECVGEEEGGGDHWDEEVDSDANPDLDDVPDDIDAEDEGISGCSVGEQMRRIVIHNNLGPHMSLIDPDAEYVSEFSKYPEIYHAHGQAVTSDDDELFIGQRFSCKEYCVYAIKRYSMKISVDYKVSVSTPTTYVGDCWKAAEGYNLRVRAAFIRSSQMWEIRKFVGPHTCTSTRMTEDHRKLDSKTICTCIMEIVKDMPTIRVSVLIAEIQARFQYRVSYRKAWVAKQMAMEQLYGDYDSSYNELQAYELEPHIFRQRMARLETDMEGQTNTSFRQWLPTMEPWQWAQSADEGFHYGHMTTKLATLMPIIGQQQVDQIQAGHVFVEHVRDAMVVNCRLARSMNVEIYSRRLETFRVTENIGRRPRSYGVDLRNRRCECRKFETLHYPCAHVVAACAKVNIAAEQYVDDVYTLERTLRVSENEFPVLPDLSMWEVPPITIELLPDRGLRRNPKGRPQSSRIRNEMDIREKSDSHRDQGEIGIDNFNNNNFSYSAYAYA